MAFLQKLNIALKALILFILPGIFIVVAVSYLATRQAFFSLNAILNKKAYLLTNQQPASNKSVTIFSEAEKSALIWQLVNRYLILGSLGGIVYVVIVYAGLNRFIIKPVQTLKAATEEVAEGKLSITVKSKQKDEIGDLYTSFNQMLAALREREAENLKLQQLLSQRYEKVKTQAVTDSLTGLYNHRYFHYRLEEEIARSKRSKKPLVLAFCDLDNFKRFNDTYGHLAGDEALRSLAAIIRKCLRVSDIAARYGGEEFALILPETDYKGARTLAERLRQDVAAFPFKTPLHSAAKKEAPAKVHMTISIGLAAFPPARSKTELLEQADKAMYQAKKLNRNRVEIYSS